MVIVLATSVVHTYYVNGESNNQAQLFIYSLVLKVIFHIHTMLELFIAQRPRLAFHHNSNLMMNIV